MTRGEKLAWWLDANNLYEKFVHNLLEQRPLYLWGSYWEKESNYDDISLAFAWGVSKEGYSFWANVEDRWFEYYRNNK